MLGPEQQIGRMYVHHVRKPTYLHKALDGSRLDDPHQQFSSLIQAGGRSASGDQQSTLFVQTASFPMCGLRIVVLMACKTTASSALALLHCAGHWGCHIRSKSAYENGTGG